ncbi:gamma-tubulin complex component 6 isoform X2 [Lemur catta]|uniref:gamma-tubulin complex component 6 isoform X2 n=1 Tax=Lemur catta TaxID=9447 RepID=UPI001E26C784|nr:gamma-tubulin complex component 6 isoform X2 [Lemur catta]
MASITQLFDDLCEALLPAAKTHLGQRSVNRKRAKQSLKRVAYNALFTNLFQDEMHQLQPDLSKLPVRNKILMLSFDLRVGGLGLEADRLEELVEELEAAPCCPLVEVGSVLDLLVQLAGSGPPQVLQRKRGYFLNNKHVGRNVPYGGYDCCDLNVFEMDIQSLISREESLCHSMIQETLQVMEAAPGTGLPTVGLFSFGDPCSDRFERDTRVSLFGALVHSRTYDMDVRLDLPPVPDSADVSGLAIKVPQSADQWEDEGFQSASNLTPDSQSEPTVTPDVDLWEAALTYEPSKRRCWERVGCPPGHREEPYLTEAGRDAFDRFCRLRHGELQLLSGGLLQAPQPVLVKECELVKDALNVLIGVVSATFSLCQPAQAFMVKRGVHVSGASPESVGSLLSEVAEYGTHYTRLSHFSLQPVLDSSYSKGLVFQGQHLCAEPGHPFPASPRDPGGVAAPGFAVGLWLPVRGPCFWPGWVAGLNPQVPTVWESEPQGRGAEAEPLPSTGARSGPEPTALSVCAATLLLAPCPQAFTSGLRRYLQYYRACVLSTPPTLSLLTIGFVFKKLGRQLRYLAELCGVGTVLPGASGGGPRAAFPTGVKLLSYLYQEALDNCSNEHYPVLLSLLKTSCEPYTRFIHDWVYSGVFRDVYGEFMIQVNHEYLGFRDKFYWTHGYVLISKDVEDCVPVFLKHIAYDVYVCGKTINLLKLCCPRHYLCWSDTPVPRISVIFSLEELKEIEKDCAVYVGRMERVARHSSISKEEKELRMEIAKQELIVHAREAASRVLSALSDRQMSEQMALDARKREQFQRLKEQFVKDQERRLAARQEELDDDFSYARELRDRERRLRALEEQLERKARQALVDHYSKLSAEAARREQRALWRIQRHRLESARLRFLLEDQKRIQGLLKDASEVQTPQEPPAARPRAPSQATSPGPEHPDGGRGCESRLREQHGAAWDCSSRPGTPAPALLGAVAMGAGGVGPRQVAGAEQPVQTGEVPLLEEVLRTISSDLPSSAPGETRVAAGAQPPGPQEYDFSSVLRPAVAPAPSPGPFLAVEGRSGRSEQPVRGDTGVQPDAHVPDTHVALPQPQPPRHVRPEEGSRPTEQLLGHLSGGGVPSEGCASGTAPSRPCWDIHRHVSDTSIGVGENVSDVAPSRPCWDIHRHVSDASIGVGENVSDVGPSRPRWNIHGHVSDASIGVGENVSDVAPSRPRWNIHGHISQSHLVLGPLSPEAEPSMPMPHRSPPGQLSRAGLSLGAPSPALERGPQSPVDTVLSVCSSGSGSGEESSLQTTPSAVARPDALGNGVPEEPGPGRSGGAEDLSLSRPLNPQEDTAGPRSPGSGKEEADAEAEAEALRWGREQAYLAGLARQYPLEQYPDSYECMSEPPAAHLLHHVRPRAFAFPVDPQVQSAADETAVQLSELLTLPVLMKRSITAPLAAHISLVNKAAVDYFFVELHLEAHCEALRHFLLMEDGEFAQSLSDLLFEKLGAGQTPGELLNPLVLNSVLSKALQYSLHGDSPHAANLSFALKFLPEVFTPNAPDVLSCLELRYKVDWPLNMVITESCLGKYSGIFSFLLQLKLMMWTLKDVCFHLKRTALVSHMASSVQFRQLQLFKHEMQHFVKVIQGYIATQILHVTWCEFRARLAAVRDLEDIQRAHAEYLHKAVFRGLLTEKAAPVMNIIHSVFSLVLKFRSQLMAQAWGPAGGPRGAEHPNFALMQQSYSTFKYYSHFLFKVVTKLVNRGYQPHLEDFLLRINFNNYYQDA